MSQDPRIRRTIDELVTGDVPPGPSIDDIARRARGRARRRASVAGAACLGVAGLTWLAVTPDDPADTTVAGRPAPAELAPEELASFCLQTLDAPVPADLTVFFGETDLFGSIAGSGLDARADVCTGVIKEALGDTAEPPATDEASTSPEQELALADDVVTFEEYEAAMARHAECSAAVGIEITPTYSEAAGLFSYELVADVPGVIDPLIAHDACYAWHVAEIEAAYVTESTRSVPTQAPEIDEIARVLEPIELGPDEWLYPSELPVGLEFDFALEDRPANRRVLFSSADGRSGATVGLIPRDLVDTDAIDEADWVVVEDAIWFRHEVWGIVRETSTGWVTVSAATEDTAIAIARRLTIVGGAALPRPSLDLAGGGFVDVATLADGSVTLGALTDGRYVATRTAGGSTTSTGCCLQLGDGDLADFEISVPSDASGTAVVAGIVDPSVATIIVTLSGGEVLEIVPEDRSGRFAVGFVLVRVPVGAAGTAPFASLEALDAGGTVIGTAATDGAGGVRIVRG